MKRLIGIFLVTVAFSTQLAYGASLLLGVNEGTSGQKGFGDVQQKYEALASFLSKTLNKPVKLESSQNLKISSTNLQKSRYDLFFSKPANVPAKAMRDQKYQLVAMAKGEFTVKYIISAKSDLKKPEDIKGKRVALAAGTFMEKAGMAELRDRGLTPNPNNLKKTQFQDALEYMLDNEFADVAMVSPVVAKKWTEKGGKVLFESRSMPFWSIIASPNMSAADVEKVRTALLNIDSTEEGKKLMETLGVKGFVAGKQQDYMDLLAWLEKK